MFAELLTKEFETAADIELTDQVEFLVMYGTKKRVEYYPRSVVSGNESNRFFWLQKDVNLNGPFSVLTVSFTPVDNQVGVDALEKLFDSPNFFERFDGSPFSEKSGKNKQ